MAGDAKFQAHADLTERSEVIIGNRISGQEFVLMGNEAAVEEVGVDRGGVGKGAELKS